MKVSIIIPCYNCEKYISKCLDSIVNQSYKNIEILLFNDGSTDSTLNILKKYSIKYNNIKVFNQQNMGVSFTRNKAIECATGEYIMFIDNDDYVDMNYVEMYVHAIGDNDIAIGGYRRTNHNNKTIKIKKIKNENWSKYMITAPWARIFKKNFLLNNNIRFFNNNIGEDVYFNVIAYSLTNKIVIMDYIGYNWFYNENSVSNTHQKKIENNLNFIGLLERIYNDLDIVYRNSDQLLEFFFIRYIVWYLLYSSKKCNLKNLKKEHDELFDFLNKNYPNFLKNKNISFFRPYGEDFSNRFIVRIYMFFYKHKIDILFLKIYSIL